MKISIARYPQLQLGHKALTKRYDQKNKASKIKRRTHTKWKGERLSSYNLYSDMKILLRRQSLR